MALSFYYELQEYYGIGKTQARLICAELGISEKTLANQINKLSLQRIKEKCKRNQGITKQQMKDAISDLRRIGCYRGNRHNRKLPANGQRTRSNAKTVKRWKL